MLDPDLTNVLKRRIGASLIDLGIVALVSGAVWRTQLIAFPIVSTDAITGEPIFDAAQRARINDIAEHLNTSFTRGDTLYALDRSGFVFTALCAIMMLALVFVLVPANTGWSPGKKLMKLAVVDADGRNPSLPAHAKRAAAGLVDLLPVVIPGLLGWVVANTDEYRQRLGDRLAATYVIDNRLGAKFIDPSVYERRRELRRGPGPDATSGDNDDMVQIGDRLGGSPSGLHRPEPEPYAPADLPDLPALDPVPPASTTIAPATPSPGLDPTPVPPMPQASGPGDLPPLPTPSTDEIDLSRLAPPSSESPDRWALDAPAPDTRSRFERAEVPPTPIDPVPIDPVPIDPVPIDPVPIETVPIETVPIETVPTPNHRFAVDAHAPTNDLGFVDDDHPELGLTAPPERLQPPITSLPDEPIDPAVHDATLVADELDLTIGAGPIPSAAPMPTHRGSKMNETDWDRPIPEPAPVWQPYAEHRASTVPGPTSAADEEPESIDVVEEPEFIDADTDVTPEPSSNAATGPAGEGLVWNEQWQAWLFWDATHEHWLRHDVASDRWIAIS